MRCAAGLILVLVLSPLGAIAQVDPPLDPFPVVVRGAAFGGEQIFEGDFTVDAQLSTFHADGAPREALDWLEGWQDRPGDSGGIVRRYHIRFVGRRTAAPGQFGPGGAYANRMLLDRLISARLLIGAGG